MRVTKAMLKAQLGTMRNAYEVVSRESNRLQQHVNDLQGEIRWQRLLIEKQGDTLLYGVKEGSFPRR